MTDLHHAPSILPSSLSSPRRIASLKASSAGPGRWLPRRVAGRLLMTTALVMVVATQAWAGVNLKLGDILIAEPGTSTISVVDPVTGAKTVISQGGLLSPANKGVAVALALDGDVIVAHREAGLIRINPVTGAQSVLSEAGFFRDPWALAINKNTGDIYVADSGYDNDRPEINEAGRIIKVDPNTGVQQVIASGAPCNSFPAGLACRNTTAAGAYLAHPYGIAIDYTGVPGSLVVADMSSFNGAGAIIRINPSNGAQTLLWGPASAVPAPQVVQQSPLGCPMGVTVEPNGNLISTAFTFPVPAAPTTPPPAGTYYGCAPPGIFRVDLINHVQTVVNANAPEWQLTHTYGVGDVIRDATTSTGNVHRVVSAGVSGGTAPAWNATAGGTTTDGSVVWQNIGLGANWLVPFGVDTEPAPTQGNPSNYNIIVGDEGYSMVFRLAANGDLINPVPVASDASYVTSIDVITFTPVGGFNSEPIRSNGQPSGVLAANTTQTTLSLNTDINATCRYSTSAGVAYGSMPNTFTTTGGTSHSRTVNGLSNGNTYNYYVRCSDSTGHQNADDFTITFTVAQPALSGPVAAFGFEDGGSDADDDSGHGHDGDIEGANWTSQGKYGDALSFDGTNDWVTIDGSPLLNLTTGMTLEAWVFPTTTTGVRDILIKEGAGGDIYNLYARNWQGLPEVNAAIGGANQTANGSAIPANVWTHVAGTYDGSVLRLFINGTQVDTTPIAGTIATSGGPLRIGGNSLWGEFFQGRIDEVRIYNRALTPAEIQADMNTPVSGFVPNTPPVRFNGQPSGSLPFGTTSATLSLNTNENATCRWSTQAGQSYLAMTAFTSTGSTAHSRSLTGLTNGTSYNYYVKCRDGANNTNPDDFVISFSVANSTTATSTFSGAENPLSEGGAWDSPGSWADLQKNDGAFTTGLNAMGRLTSPAMNADQYSQITYDQDPGAGTWVGVGTRIQNGADGSGYLAIAYNGAVQLYRVDDSGGLSFTLLASTNVSIGTAPRQLRLESQGNTHRVLFNGTQVLTHNATGLTYGAGQPAIAASVFGGPLVRILSFDGGNLSAGGSDTTPPVRFNGQPAGTLPWGTTQATVSLTTGENATCRNSTSPGVSFNSMPNTFTTTGGTSHSRIVTGLTNGTTYNFYVKCRDAANNANTDDFAITFSVASSASATSSFAGTESPLSEGGVWDSPGSWADLEKNAGAFTSGLNAQARLATPLVSANHYSEITFDQDPGASTWVGVTTRVQGSNNGSGYLAIAYAGEVRLYRADDSGSLSFTQLASAAASLGTGPRQLRLESQGNTHRVYFNGALLITHNASGTIYANGQPGIAASVFGGPQVKILSFQGGNLP